MEFSTSPIGVLPKSASGDTPAGQLGWALIHRQVSLLKGSFDRRDSRCNIVDHRQAISYSGKVEGDRQRSGPRLAQALHATQEPA
jgi:hypothetical protein